MKIRIASLQVLALLAAGCGNSNAAPWLTMPDAAAHAQYFPIGTGSVHAGADCNKCHSDAAGQPSASFTTFNCVGCHDVVVAVVAGANVLHGSASSLATLHTPVAGFNALWTGPELSTACLACHPDGSGGAPSNHEQLFPRGPGTAHAAFSCIQCHGTGPRDAIAAQACASCHQSDATFATAHRAPLDHTSTGQNVFTLLDMTSPVVCLRCHAPSPTNRAGLITPILRSAHSTGEDSINTGKHVNVGCVDCHNGTRTVEGSYQAQDFTRRSCLICHSSNNP